MDAVAEVIVLLPYCFLALSCHSNSSWGSKTVLFIRTSRYQSHPVLGVAILEPLLGSPGVALAGEKELLNRACERPLMD